MATWPEIPTGDTGFAMARFGAALGSSASNIVDRMKKDQPFVEALAQTALEKCRLTRPALTIEHATNLVSTVKDSLWALKFSRGWDVAEGIALALGLPPTTQDDLLLIRFFHLSGYSVSMARMQELGKDLNGEGLGQTNVFLVGGRYESSTLSVLQGKPGELVALGYCAITDGFKKEFCTGFRVEDRLLVRNLDLLTLPFHRAA